MADNLDWTGRKIVEARDLNNNTTIFGMFKNFPEGVKRYQLESKTGCYTAWYRLYEVKCALAVQCSKWVKIEPGEEFLLSLPEKTLNHAWRNLGSKIDLNTPKDLLIQLFYKNWHHYVIVQACEFNGTLPALQDVRQLTELLHPKKGIQLVEYKEPPKLDGIEPKDWA